MTLTGALLEKAQQLLLSSKRQVKNNEIIQTSYSFVALKRENLEHADFFELIDSIADAYRLAIVYPRLSEYVVGDFISEHSDTIPLAKKAVSIRLDEGSSRLIIAGQLIPEGDDKAVIFDPSLKHEVLPIEIGARIVILFWLV